MDWNKTSPFCEVEAQSTEAIWNNLGDIGDDEAPSVFAIDDNILEDDVTDNPEDVFFSDFLWDLSKEEYENSTKAENDDN